MKFMSAVDYVSNFYNGGDSDDNGVATDEINDETLTDDVAVEGVNENSDVSFETKFAVLFQKFLVYGTSISVGIIIINIMYILLFSGADILPIVANIFAMVALVAINERIR